MSDLMYTLRILWHNFIVRLAEAGAWLIVFLFFLGCSFSLIAVQMVQGDFKVSLEIFNTWVQEKLTTVVGCGVPVLFLVLFVLYLLARSREHRAYMETSSIYSVARISGPRGSSLAVREQEQFNDPDFLANYGGNNNG